MAGYCKDCRFYMGRKCVMSNHIPNPTSSCSKFASNTRSETKMCKDCRFYENRKCVMSNHIPNPTSSCSKFSPYR